MEQFETEIYLRYKQIIQGSAALAPKECMPGTRHVHMADLLDRYDAFCFDGYGTLYNRGSFVYPGAMDWFQSLRRAGKILRLVTNAASDVDGVLARAAEKRGFDFSTEETISSGSLLPKLVERLRRGERMNGNAAVGIVNGCTGGTAAKPLELREV